MVPKFVDIGLRRAGIENSVKYATDFPFTNIAAYIQKY